jgi:hypothetical protein
MLLRLLGIVVAAALVIAAAPVSLVAGASAALAWRAGWPPGRLYRAALYCLPMLAVWLAATAVATRSAAHAAATPYLAWLAMWHRGAAGSYPGAAAVIAPAAIPAGLAAGALAWSYRIRSMHTGSGGLSPDAAAAFDRRQWRHQARSARARIAAPGAVTLTTRHQDLVAGAVIRTVGHPARPAASIPYTPDALPPGSHRHHRHRQPHSPPSFTSLRADLHAPGRSTHLPEHCLGPARRSPAAPGDDQADSLVSVAEPLGIRGVFRPGYVGELIPQLT